MMQDIVFASLYSASVGFAIANLIAVYRYGNKAKGDRRVFISAVASGMYVLIGIFIPYDILDVLEPSGRLLVTGWALLVNIVCLLCTDVWIAEDMNEECDKHTDLEP